MVDNAQGDICRYYGGTRLVNGLGGAEGRKAAQAATGRTETGTAPPEHDYADDIDNEGYDDEDGWLDQECALGDDGQCGLAGTEHCDFECPYRDSEDFAGSEAWRKKHAARSPAPPFAGCRG